MRQGTSPETSNNAPAHASAIILTRSFYLVILNQYFRLTFSGKYVCYHFCNTFMIKVTLLKGYS